MPTRWGFFLYPRRYTHYYILVLYQNKALTESGERYWCGKKFTVGASVSKKTNLQGFHHPLYFTKR